MGLIDLVVGSVTYAFLWFRESSAFASSKEHRVKWRNFCRLWIQTVSLGLFSVLAMWRNFEEFRWFVVKWKWLSAFQNRIRSYQCKCKESQISWFWSSRGQMWFFRFHLVHAYRCYFDFRSASWPFRHRFCGAAISRPREIAIAFQLQLAPSLLIPGIQLYSWTFLFLRDLLFYLSSNLATFQFPLVGVITVEVFNLLNI